MGSDGLHFIHCLMLAFVSSFCFLPSSLWSKERVDEESAATPAEVPECREKPSGIMRLSEEGMSRFFLKIVFSNILFFIYWEMEIWAMLIDVGLIAWDGGRVLLECVILVCLTMEPASLYTYPGAWCFTRPFVVVMESVISSPPTHMLLTRRA